MEVEFKSVAIYSRDFQRVKANYQISVLAEFIGGAWQPGNALAMNFFKCFGYKTYSSPLRNKAID